MQTRTNTKNSEDSLLELRIRLERWAKRNRFWIIGAITVVLLWLGALGIWALMENSRVQAANNALTTLQSDPSDQAALATLQSRSPQLHGLFLLGQAAQSNDTATLEQLASGNDLAADLAAYQLALLSEEASALAAYTQREGAPLKELAFLSEAILWHEEGAHQKAREALARIGFDSNLRDLAGVLSHYGVTQE